MKPPFDISADLDTPVSAYRKLTAFRPSFLLESVEGGARVARYSFLGLDPAFTVRVSLDYERSVLRAEIRRDDEDASFETDASSQGMLSLLRQLRDDAPPLLPDDGSLPFAGGIVGATGYDAVRCFEMLPPPDGRSTVIPIAVYVAPRSMLVFDHLSRRAALLHAGEPWRRESLRKEIVHALRGPHPAEPIRAGHSPAEPSVSREGFLQAVERGKHHITEGDVFQLVLSIRYEGEHVTDPFQVYRALRLLNPSSYMYFLDVEGTNVVGSSPEALFRMQGREASLRPIAGTRPRGETQEEDARLEAELLADEKEAAEHVMLVDLARNDLGRIAEPGSVRVDPYRIIERYSHVMHLVSGVSATVEQGRDSLDVLSASFPAGTLVGTPKVRAMELIDEIEPVARGLYAGTVGYYARGGDSRDASADQAICIRTIMFEGGRYAYQAGAGIVADSSPESEFDEVRNKVAALERALELAREGFQ